MTEDTNAVENTVAAEEVTPKAPGIGKIAREALLKGATNEEALNAVKEVHPNAGASLATISWYRNNLRKTHPEVKTARQITQENKPVVVEEPKPAGKRGRKPKAAEVATAVADVSETSVEPVADVSETSVEPVADDVLA